MGVHRHHKFFLTQHQCPLFELWNARPLVPVRRWEDIRGAHWRTEQSASVVEILGHTGGAVRRQGDAALSDHIKASPYQSMFLRSPVAPSPSRIRLQSLFGHSRSVFFHVHSLFSSRRHADSQHCHPSPPCSRRAGRRRSRGREAVIVHPQERPGRAGTQ